MSHTLIERTASVDATAPIAPARPALRVLVGSSRVHGRPLQELAIARAPRRHEVRFAVPAQRRG